jgi:hypothetical protein
MNNHHGSLVYSQPVLSMLSAGNKQLRNIIDKNIEKYSSVKSKLEKSMIVSAIVDSIKEKAGKDGGFVRQDKTTKQWCEVSDKLAREKVGQAFRAEMRKKSKTDSPSTAFPKEKRTADCSNEEEDLSWSPPFSLIKPAISIPPNLRVQVDSSFLAEKRAARDPLGFHEDWFVPSEYTAKRPQMRADDHVEVPTELHHFHRGNDATFSLLPCSSVVNRRPHEGLSALRPFSYNSRSSFAGVNGSHLGYVWRTNLASAPVDISSPLIMQFPTHESIPSFSDATANCFGTGDAGSLSRGNVTNSILPKTPESHRNKSMETSSPSSGNCGFHHVL